MITKDQAKTLAVAYEAFLSLRGSTDHESIAIWGRILGRVQAETDIILVNPTRLAAEVAAAMVLLNAPLGWNEVRA